MFQYKGKLVEEMEIESALRKGMRTWARWIDHHVDASKTTVFFRSISPLNITKLSEYRRDAHPALYARKQEKLLKTVQQLQEKSQPDCSHWCLPGLPDTWNRLLYASLVVDTSNSKHLDQLPLIQVSFTESCHVPWF